MCIDIYVCMCIYIYIHTHNFTFVLPWSPTPGLFRSSRNASIRPRRRKAWEIRSKDAWLCPKKHAVLTIYSCKILLNPMLSNYRIFLCFTFWLFTVATAINLLRNRYCKSSNSIGLILIHFRFGPTVIVTRLLLHLPQTHQQHLIAGSRGR